MGLSVKELQQKSVSQPFCRSGNCPLEYFQICIAINNKSSVDNFFFELEFPVFYINSSTLYTYFYI